MAWWLGAWPRALLRATAGAALVACAACSSNKASGGGGGSPGADSCTPDPALIAQARACRADDQCPCGSHCTLGRCAADCSEAAACASGQRCDPFGRCRSAEDTGLVSPVSTATQGGIQLQNTSLIVAPDAGASVRFQATGHDLSTVRLQASDGYALQCADGGWSGSCTDNGLALGAQRAVAVVPIAPDGGAPAAGAGGAIGTVTIFTGGGSQTVSLNPAPAAPTGVPGGLAGAYSGTATLSSVTLTHPSLPTADAGTAGVSSATFTVPITAQVFATSGATSGVIVLIDPLQALNPKGTWIGAMTIASATSGSIKFPTVLAESGSLTMAMQSEILEGVTAAPYVLSGSGRSLLIQADVTFQGLGLGARAPDARWQISLQKAGPLQTGASAPAVPADATPTLASTAATTPSDWSEAEQGLYQTFSSGSTTAEQQAVLATWRAVADPTVPLRVDACSDPGRLVAGTQARADEWQAAVFAPPSPTNPSMVLANPLITTGKEALLGEVLNLDTTNYVVYAAATQVGPPSGDPPIPAPDGSIPCAVAFQPSDVYCYDGTTTTTLLQLPSIDRCAAIAAEMQCDVQTKDGGPFDFDLTLNTEATTAGAPACGDPTTQTPNLIKGEVTKVCVLPKVAWNCGDLVQCAQSDGRTAFSPSTPLQVSGDLLCGTGGASSPLGDAGADAGGSAAPPGNDSLATVADWNRNQPANTDSVSTVVDGVVSDFARLTGAPSAPFAPALDFDAPRQLVALEYATEIDRERATATPAPPVNPRATRSANRMFQQWATMQALIAHEASQRAQVPDMVTGLTPDPKFPTPAQALVDSLDEWLLFLHPRFATAISMFDGASLVQPDYRPDWNVAAGINPNDTEGDGLPTAVLDALTAQFTLLGVVTYQGALASDATVLPLTGRALRDAILMQSLARDLYARVVAANGGVAPPWGAKFLQSDQALTGAIRAAVKVASALALGKNPLGIEDSDLPLYFQGVTVDPTAEFSAISDYLIGTGSTTNAMAWAPLAVARAQTAAAAVSAAVQAQETRQYQQALATVDAANRLDQIRTDAGNALSNYCGLPASVTPLTAIEDWTNFNASTCFVRTEVPGCAIDQSAEDALLDPPSVLYQLCVATRLATASSSVAYAAEDMEAVLSQTLLAPTPCEFGPTACEPQLSGPPKVGCIQCGAVVTGDMTVAKLAGLDLAGVTSDMVQAAQATCAAQYPSAAQGLPSVDSPGGPLSNPSCLSGSIGDDVFTLRSANQNIQVALSQMQDHIDAYDIEVKNCLLLEAENSSLQSLEAAHDSTMSSLRSAKAADDEGADVAQAVYNCAMAVTTAAGSGVGAEAVGAAGAAVGCGAAALEAVFQTESIETQEQMDNADAEYQAEMDTIQQNASVAQCMNEAHQELVGMRTAEQQVQAAYLDFDHAQYDLTQGVASAQQIYSEATQAIATSKARTLRPPALDPWADQRLTAYASAMSEARRVTYLAERAVEYEYQASLADRAAVLAAQTPDQLASVLVDLHDTSGTLSIQGSRPSNLKVVLSLRDQLLQLYDASRAPAGEQQLDPEARFKLLLRDPRFAVYTNGAYAGQSIPFSLAPLAALHGNALGIPVLSSTDCAERVWSVNASILGSQRLERGSQTTFARLDLLKKNTFFSQWCGAPPQGVMSTQFQVASVNPSHNLFLDPMYGSAVQGSTMGAAPSDSVPSEVALDSRARIQAYFNVPQATFEQDSYANGDTSELAARGLYGDYALFFSSDILSLPETDANGNVTGFTNGLDLSQVDDILLRIDYVSVAQ